MAEPSHRRRWPRILGIAAGVVLLLLGLAYFLIVRKVRAVLATAIRDNLQAKLEDGTVWYLPPYGVSIRNARLVSDSRDVRVLKVKRIDVRLAGLPKAGAPVVIDELKLVEPQVRLLRSEAGEVVGGPEPTPINRPPPRKLSEKLQIRNLTIEGASFTYEDRGDPGGPVLAAEGLSLTMLPPTAAGGAQAFSFHIKDPIGDVSAQGLIHPDDGLLDLHALSAQLKLGTPTTALPPAVARAISRYHVTGGVRIASRGTFPLNDLAASDYQATIDLVDVAAGLPGADVVFDRINLRLACDDDSLPRDANFALAAAPDPSAASRPTTVHLTPAGPGAPAFHVKVDRANMAVGESGLTIAGGEFWFDPAQGRWKLIDFSGFVQGPQRATPQDLSGQTAGVRKLARAADVFNLRGRLDFTAAAAGPTRVPAGKQATDVVQYEVLAYPRAFAFKPRKWPVPIENVGGGGSIRIAGGDVVISDITGTYGGDKLTLRSATLPIPENAEDFWQLETRVAKLDGTVTFYQPGPQYPKGINNVISTLRPEGPFDIGGRFTLGHKPGAKDDYSLIVSSNGGGAFTLTDRRLPLTGVRGRAQIDPLRVVVEPTQANVMGGTLVANLEVLPGRTTLYEGRAHLVGTDVALLSQALGLKRGNTADRLSGRGYADFGFIYPASAAEAIRPGSTTVPSTRAASRRATATGPARDGLYDVLASGEIQVIGGRFIDDPVLGRVAADVGPRSTTRGGTSDAAVLFTLDDGVFALEEAAVNAQTVGLQGTGTISLDGDLNLNVYAAPLGDIRDKLKRADIPVISDVAAGIAGGVQDIIRGVVSTVLYQYRIGGHVNAPTHQVVPAPLLTDPAAALFGSMAREEKPEGKLLEGVKAKREKGK